LEYPEFISFAKDKLDENWIELVNEARNILVRGKETEEQINILGDDSVPIDYHVTLWKSEFVDFIILQQDAFDKIDASTSLERQEYMLKKVISVTRSKFKFEGFEEVATYFKRLINVFRQLNYTVFKSEEFYKTEEEAMAILEERLVK
jgi:V/A-type H+-transporting ATPase subunit A